jgi:hypothetical protein
MDTVPKMADTDGDIVQCTCAFPSGFKFMYAESDYQVWEHIQCGGLVTRMFVRAGEKLTLWI